MGYVTEWITPTQKLVGNFNDVASELPSSEETPAEAKTEAESGRDSPPAEPKLDEKDLERVRERANKLVYDIAVSIQRFFTHENVTNEMQVNYMVANQNTLAKKGAKSSIVVAISHELCN